LVFASNDPYFTRLYGTSRCHHLTSIMSTLSKYFQSQWRDLTNSHYVAGKREKGPGKRRARRSTQLFGVFLLAIFFTLTWQFYKIQVESVGRKPRLVRKANYAIVTYETRDVTYWRESLGNKYSYARRHGYSKFKIVFNGSYDLYAFFQKPKYDDKGGVWSKIVLVNETLQTGNFEWALWMDFDTLFTNMSSKMEHFMENAKSHLKQGQRWEDVSMIAASDWYRITISN
jgi:hypothetical protein